MRELSFTGKGMVASNHQFFDQKWTSIPAQSIMLQPTFRMSSEYTLLIVFLLAPLIAVSRHCLPYKCLDQIVVIIFSSAVDTFFTLFELSDAFTYLIRKKKPLRNERRLPQSKSDIRLLLRSNKNYLTRFLQNYTFSLTTHSSKLGPLLMQVSEPSMRLDLFAPFRDLAPVQRVGIKAGWKRINAAHRCNINSVVIVLIV